MKLKIERHWAMPNKWTFLIEPVKKLLSKYEVGKKWIDPFCGLHSPAEFRNDLNPNNTHTQHHLEAIDFLNLKEWDINGALFDPPYSLTQVSKSYNDIGLKFKSKENPTGGFPKVRKRLAELLNINQYCISFGWNTCGLGKKNNMEIVEILIISHGGNRNDTLVTVERKNA
jgi:hypothetical protein